MMPAEKTKPLWPRVPPSFVKGQLLAHKLIGLSVAAVMYLICLTGSIAVFYADFERWEKPTVPEMHQASPEAIARAVAHTRAKLTQENAETHDVFFTLPSAEMPRLIATYDEQTLAFDEAGKPAGSADHDLTHFLVEMHYALNLPSQIGIILVGVLGVLLVALIVGGALALPRAFRDAFTLRLDGGRRLQRVDIHNRIAVWGLPFHFVVALSGAIMGIALVVLAMAGPLQAQGDSARILADLFGDHEKIAAEAQKAGPPKNTEPEARIVASLATLARQRPDNPPLYIALDHFNTPEENVTIGAGHPTRLIFAETYIFDSAGGLMATGHSADGEAGRQVYASMFRLHAGAFGGVTVKFLYLALGLTLTFLCTTGVDIWLAKAVARGRALPRIQSVWTTFVWGTPTLLGAACALSLAASAPPLPIFWLGLLIVSVAGIWIPQRFAQWAGPAAAAAGILAIPIAHTMQFGGGSWEAAALAINAGLMVTALLLAALSLRNWRRTTAFPAQAELEVSTAA